MLNQIHHGAPGGRPLLIVHGLFGSARNWGAIGKRLSDRGHVVAVDLRNHGDSPWKDTNSYHDLAADLAEVIEELGGSADVLGHSMGGKASMVLALQKPDLVNRLIVADIAPVNYTHSQMQYIDAMNSVDLSQVMKRADAAAQLAKFVDDTALQSFFTQSLDVAGKMWKLNLGVLATDMDKILSFPEVEGNYPAPTLFLSGALSDYVQSQHKPRIRELFPKARFAKVPGAGHWLHAEKPREFEASVRAFLDA